MSQVFNLYFVAYREKIHVYEPRFRDQALSSAPSLIIDTPAFDPTLHIHGVDHRVPHSINNLEVATFGTEEFVVVVRDDGDWDSYLTRHIHDHIHAHNGSFLSSDALKDLRPLFHYNVGSSAWGLAVHSQARIIAVSSNEHKVNIFKFALADPEPFDSADPPTQLVLDGPSTQCGSNVPGRSRDEWFKVDVDSTNIPQVAFCNTGDDPQGRWLLATDLTGYVVSIDLFERRRHVTCCPAYFTPLEHEWDPKQLRNPGWGVAFLQRQSFRPVRLPSTTEIRADEIVLSLDKARRDWDLSSTVDRFGRLNARFYPPPPTGHVNEIRKLQPPNLMTLYNLVFDINNDSTVAEISTQRLHDPQVVAMKVDQFLWQLPALPSSMFDASDLSRRSLPLIARLRHKWVTDQPSLKSVTAVQRIAAYQDLSSSDLGKVLLNRLKEGTSLANSARPYRDVDEDAPELSDDDKEFIEAMLDLGLQTPILGFDEDKPLCSSLPCPILVLATHSVALLQPIGHEADAQVSDAHLPVVHINNAFDVSKPYHRDEVKPQYQDRNAADRTCFQVEIPSLGALIVGNQKGPVVVFSLVKECADLDLDPPCNGLGDMGEERVKASDRTVYGMSMEYRLPRVEDDEDAVLDEDMGMTRILTGKLESDDGRKVSRAQHLLHDIHGEVVKLVGLSVGPMQGTMHLPDDQKRWRMMLMYSDHSVWSYEIWLRDSPCGGNDRPHV